MAPPPSPWPRLRDSWWVYALAGLALAVFAVALVEDVRCGLRRCPEGLVARLFALDALGGLPRLYTTGLFVAVAALGWLGRVRSAGRHRLWWTAVAGIGAALAVAKLVSAHSAAKGASALATFLVSAVLVVVVLAALTVTGRRWAVPATRPVVQALGVYAAAALGLDAITSLLVALQAHVGLLTWSAVTFAEELGEALTALLLLVTLRWNLPAAPAREAALSTRRPPGEPPRTCATG